jgi:hypothetical protein
MLKVHERRADLGERKCTGVPYGAQATGPLAILAGVCIMTNMEYHGHEVGI